MSIRNGIGFALMKLGHNFLDPQMARVVALATVVGQAWMSDNRDQTRAILSGEACLTPVPGSLRGMIKNGDETEHQTVGFGTKH